MSKSFSEAGFQADRRAISGHSLGCRSSVFTSIQVNPFGASPGGVGRCCGVAQFARRFASCFSLGPQMSQAARISPIPARTTSPQNSKSGIVFIRRSSLVCES